MKHTEYIIPIGEEAKEFDEIFIGVLRKHKELIRCKDCRFRDKDGECAQFDAYASAAGDLFSPPDWFYCGYGKRKEEEGETETWHSLKGNIKAPKGTFDKIYEDDEL